MFPRHPVAKVKVEAVQPTYYDSDISYVCICGYPQQRHQQPFNCCSTLRDTRPKSQLPKGLIERMWSMILLIGLFI
jgi:hypothetical protein